jgi:dihydroneopterin aldolase
MHELWDPNRSYQRIALRDLEITMRVGIAEIELKQLNPQRVIVNVELFSHKDAHMGDSIKACFNYHPVHEYIVENWSNRPHTDLLETLVDELCDFCLVDERVEACRVSIQKPEIYDDTKAAMVEFYRVRTAP